ncbi:3-methyl-2-oxobutanoate hydroxymethyltransferase, partial [Candidatus Woesearchaeota archaeon]|nr:3-methyl-2-oxobutanoate hydroxymethyltransferase [Candidatus Woesearchaeota archaeon]
MKQTIETIKAMKGSIKITMLTAYDYPTAKLQDEAGIDIILIGDSLGMVVLGYENTLSVTMDDMMRHTGAVARGAKNALIIGDMPAGSFDKKEDAILNAEALMKLGADAVKIEKKPDIAKALVENNIPVMGHVGLTPHTAKEFKVQGKNEEKAKEIIEEAKELDRVGCFSIVIE